MSELCHKDYRRQEQEEEDGHKNFGFVEDRKANMDNQKDQLGRIAEGEVDSMSYMVGSEVAHIQRSLLEGPQYRVAAALQSYVKIHIPHPVDNIP